MGLGSAASTRHVIDIQPTVRAHPDGSRVACAKPAVHESLLDGARVIVEPEEPAVLILGYPEAEGPRLPEGAAPTRGIVPTEPGSEVDHGKVRVSQWPGPCVRWRPRSTGRRGSGPSAVRGRQCTS